MIEAACLRYLSRREHAQAELRRKLVAKGHPEDIVDEILAEMAEKGLQSDVRYVESYARSRVEKGFGDARIRQELRRRGIRDGVETELEEVDWDERLEALYRKKFGDDLPDSPATLASRQRFLLQRGFGFDQIRRLFRRLRQNADF